MFARRGRETLLVAWAVKVSKRYLLQLQRAIGPDHAQAVRNGDAAGLQAAADLAAPVYLLIRWFGAS